jgi:hypothetical protein
VASDLLTRVRDTCLKLLSKLFPPPSTPEPLPQSEKEKPKVNSLYRSRKELKRKLGRTASKGSSPTGTKVPGKKGSKVNRKK